MLGCDKCEQWYHGEKLWPPYGLIQSQAAIDVLGKVCCAIRDDVDVLVEDSLSKPSTGNESMICTLPVMEKEVFPPAEMENSVGMQVSISNLPLLDLDKEKESTAIITMDPLDSFHLNGLTSIKSYFVRVPQTSFLDNLLQCFGSILGRDTGL